MIPICILAMEDEGDRDFMARLYTKYNRLMYQEIYQILKDRWATEDVLQNTIEKLISKVDDLRSKDRKLLVNYIVTASKHHAFNYIRDNQKHTALSLDEYFDISDPNSGRGSIESLLIQWEDLKQLSTIWEKLDERSKFLLEGYYILGKTHEDLAVVLSIKPASVRMALTRARRCAFQLLESEINQK